MKKIESTPFFTLQSELDGLERAGLYRRLRRFDETSVPIARIEGRAAINFASNDYLGLTRHPAVIAAAADALERYGSGCGASRLTSGNLHLYATLEQALARLKNCEDCVVFSSGYAANLGAISALVGPGDAVIIDKLNHASIIDGCRLSRAKLYVYPHKDVERLGQILSSMGKFRRRLIITDSIFSMDGDLAPLSEICSLAKEYEAIVMIDDAHATGVLEVPGAECADIRMGTLSKAIGSIGGFVAGPRAVCEYLRNKARSLIYSTALPAAALAAAIAAIEVSQKEPQIRETLWYNTRRIKQNSQGPIIPIIIGDSQKAMEAARTLFEKGIYAPAIRPPTVPRGTERIRISVSAAHKDEHIDRLLDEIRQFSIAGIIRQDTFGGTGAGGRLFKR